MAHDYPIIILVSEIISYLETSRATPSPPIWRCPTRSSSLMIRALSSSQVCGQQVGSASAPWRCFCHTALFSLNGFNVVISKNNFITRIHPSYPSSEFWACDEKIVSFPVDSWQDYLIWENNINRKSFLLRLFLRGWIVVMVEVFEWQKWRNSGIILKHFFNCKLIWCFSVVSSKLWKSDKKLYFSSWFSSRPLAPLSWLNKNL